jgi:polyribonucleotide 5'-hydroxyl-kinase
MQRTRRTNSTDVNVEKKKLTVLAPCPGPLPSRFVVVGALKWYE